MTLLLTRSDIGSVIGPRECLTAVEQAFRDYGEGKLAAPVSIGLHAAKGTFHVKAAIGDHFVAKINANFPGNPRSHGLPTIQGVIVLADADRGTPFAILDSALITTLRTAAATAIAADRLARRDASVVSIIGCGTQGRASLDALRLVRDVREAFVFDVDRAAADRLASEASRDFGIGVRAAASIDEAIGSADVVVTCTPSRAAFLERRHLRPGLFIAAVGADNPEKHELAPEVLRDAKVVADIADQAAKMGDLHHAIAAGIVSRDDIHGELADVLCGRVPARTSAGEIFVFDSTGTALQDVAAASIAYARALERGTGTEIAFDA